LVFVQTTQGFLEAGYRRCRTGLNHRAFHAGTPVEIDQWRKEFLTRRAKLLYDDCYPHTRGSDHYSLYLEDPDGIKIELVGGKRNSQPNGLTISRRLYEKELGYF
jgi:catechol 2,3-dioxygenase-like lactoylglutathione lyase family enzyme